MKKIFWLILAAGGVFLFIKAAKAAKEVSSVKTVNPLPSGASLTGKVTQTTNGRSPNYGDEVVGFGIRNWAEVILADGTKDWVELAL